MPTDYLHHGTQSRENAHESEYDSPAGQVLYPFEGNVGSKFGGLDSLSVAATSDALDSNSSWAFVTIHDFDFVGLNTMALIETRRVSFNPLVTEENREIGKSLSDNAGWVWQAVARKLCTQPSSRELSQKIFRKLQASPDFSQEFPKQIYKIDPSSELQILVEESPGPYLPS